MRDTFLLYVFIPVGRGLHGNKVDVTLGATFERILRYINSVSRTVVNLSVTWVVTRQRTVTR